MQALRAGTCRGCRKPFERGTPIFFHPEEGAWHWDCFEAQPQPRWVIDLASKLNYRPTTVFEDNEKDWSF